jgi:hypothetical protein
MIEDNESGEGLDAKGWSAARRLLDAGTHTPRLSCGTEYMRERENQDVESIYPSVPL